MPSFGYLNVPLRKLKNGDLLEMMSGDDGFSHCPNLYEIDRTYLSFR
jgi:hypothetical protein